MCCALRSKLPAILEELEGLEVVLEAFLEVDRGLP
jgi:hypothetical protein